MDENNRMTPEGAAPQVEKATQALMKKREYPVDRRDRAGLALTLGLAVLLADLVLTIVYGFPGLGVTLLILAWEGLLFWYVWGGNTPMVLKKPSSLWLTAAVLLLAADFALFSNRWFRMGNVCALLLLLTVQMFELFGAMTVPWWRPSMLLERGFLLLAGLLDRLPASMHALVGNGEKPAGRRAQYVLLGLAVAVPLLCLVFPLLTQADAVFGLLAERAADFFYARFGALAGRVLAGAVAAPFLFGLLYFLRRPDPSWSLGGLAGAKTGGADPAFTVTVLAVLDGLYLLFVGVQFRALFGGGAYLSAVGLSMAEYARSGFFQLVWVSAINLAVVLAAVQFTGRTGELWRWVQRLSTAMAALSGVLLLSAAWRMSLYVGTYGLSVKRFLTYWGMIMLALFLGAALLKVWRTEFAFFRVLFAGSLAGWILLNAVNVDAVVSRYNVACYHAGNLEVLDTDYLSRLSYDALPALELLDGSRAVRGYAVTGEHEWAYTLDELIRDRRITAAAECASWRTWCLSAYLAAGEG